MPATGDGSANGAMPASSRRCMLTVAALALLMTGVVLGWLTSSSLLDTGVGQGNDIVPVEVQRSAGASGSQRSGTAHSGTGNPAVAGVAHDSTGAGSHTGGAGGDGSAGEATASAGSGSTPGSSGSDTGSSGSSDSGSSSSGTGSSSSSSDTGSSGSSGTGSSDTGSGGSSDTGSGGSSSSSSSDTGSSSSSDTGSSGSSSDTGSGSSDTGSGSSGSSSDTGSGSSDTGSGGSSSSGSSDTGSSSSSDTGSSSSDTGSSGSSGTGSGSTSGSGGSSGGGGGEQPDAVSQLDGWEPSLRTLPYEEGACTRVLLNVIPHGGFGSAFIRSMSGVIIAHKTHRQFVEHHATGFPYDDGCTAGRKGLDCFFRNFSNCGDVGGYGSDAERAAYAAAVPTLQVRGGGHGKDATIVDSERAPVVVGVHAFDYKGYGTALDDLALKLHCLEARKACVEAHGGAADAPQCARVCEELQRPELWNYHPVPRVAQLRLVARAMWHLRDSVVQEIEQRRAPLKLRHPYAVVHMRKGDKFKEAPRTRGPVYVRVVNDVVKKQLGVNIARRRLTWANAPADAHPDDACSRKHLSGGAGAVDGGGLRGAVDTTACHAGWQLGLEPDHWFDGDLVAGAAGGGRRLGEDQRMQVYVMGDEYSGISNIMAGLNQHKVQPLTLANPDYMGFQEHKFRSQDTFQGRTKHQLALEMLTDFAIAFEADVFVGTQSSNVGSIVQLLRTQPPHTAVDVLSKTDIKLRECARAEERACFRK